MICSATWSDVLLKFFLSSLSSDFEWNVVLVSLVSSLIWFEGEATEVIRLEGGLPLVHVERRRLQISHVVPL